MKSLKRILLFSFLLLLSNNITIAEVRVVASAPQVVAKGEQFRIEYEVNTQNVKNVQVLKNIPGFEILYGPSKSSSFSMQIINGKQSSVSSITYGYTLMAKEEGSFTLPAISVTVDGASYKSNTPKIKVVPAASSGNQGGGGSSSQQSPSAISSKSDATHISNKDLFITVTANKGQVYEQEPVLLTYRVYTRLNLTQLGGKMPDLKGFMAKEVPLPQQKSFSIDNYNGQNYYTTVWSQYVMFPQQTGKLTVPSIKFDGIVVFPDPDIDPLEAFFNGGSSSIQKKKTVVSPSINITVKPLPEKPLGFTGAVGNFTIKSTLKTPHPKENESLDLQVQITGTGNVDLIKAPTVKFPADFDTYAPKQNSQSKLTTSGMNGTMTIDYIAVPKHRGKYTIPSIEFIYFDTSSGAYKTIQTDPISFEVAKGEKNVYSDKQREILAKSDIRFIKKNDVRLRQKEDLFWNKPSYWLYYVIAIILFLAILVWLRRNARLQGDVVGRRIRGASRIVNTRLKKARKLMQENNVDEFYDETLHAMQGYVSDKLSIPISDLSRENIQVEFVQQKVPQELSDKFLSLLSDCEFYRFSQDKEKQLSPSQIYDEVADTISKLDSILKKHKK